MHRKATGWVSADFHEKADSTHSVKNGLEEGRTGGRETCNLVIIVVFRNKDEVLG